MRVLKNSIFKIIGCLCFVFCSIFLFCGEKSTTFANAEEVGQMESEAIEGIELVNNDEQIAELNGGAAEVVLIEGEGNSELPVRKEISSFENIVYISNANYFLLNPQHKKNDGSDNENGTCTTVAIQMLLGYHNYYSDRRIIPKLQE